MIPGEDDRSLEAPDRDISDAGFRQLADFRHCIRQFLHFSEEAARSKGIEPHQHEVLLAIKGLPGDVRPTITTLSRCLFLRHHSTVEVVNRLEARGAVKRHRSDEDHREVLIELTPHGEDLLHRLSILHWEELHVSGPALAHALCAVVQHAVWQHRRGA